MPRTIHIAVLDVDIPPRTLYETHGLCSAHFRNALQNAATRLNALTGSDLSIAVTPYDIRGGHYPDFRHLRKTQTPLSENSIDAILITGGAPGVYEIDERPWMRRLAKFLQTVFQEYPAVRIMGTCFGNQLIGHALVDSGAGDVYVEKCPLGREVGIHTVQLNREFIDAFPLALGGLPDGQLKIQMFHGDRVMVKGTVSGVFPETAAVSLPPAVDEYREHAYMSYSGNVLPRPGTLRARTLRARCVRDAKDVSGVCTVAGLDGLEAGVVFGAGRV